MGHPNGSIDRLLLPFTFAHRTAITWRGCSSIVDNLRCQGAAVVRNPFSFADTGGEFGIQFRRQHRWPPSFAQGIDAYDPSVRTASNRYFIANGHHLGRFGPVAVDVYLAASYCFRCQMSSLEKSGNPKPFIQAHICLICLAWCHGLRPPDSIVKIKLHSLRRNTRSHQNILNTRFTSITSGINSRIVISRAMRCKIMRALV